VRTIWGVSGAGIRAPLPQHATKIRPKNSVTRIGGRIDPSVKIQVNSDSSIRVDDAVIRYVTMRVNRGLQRFAPRLTRVEVHLTDVNRRKFGTTDKRCMIEARPARHRPLSVSNAARTVRESVSGALTKMQSALQTFFDRLGERRPATAARAHRKVAARSTPATTPRRAATASRKRASSAKKKPIYQARRKSWPAR
jgi:hypothetical protein